MKEGERGMGQSAGKGEKGRKWIEGEERKREKVDRRSRKEK